MHPTQTTDYWRKCTTCKNPIGFKQIFWVCSVSSCNRQRTGLVFCSVACFDAHVPVLNHRDAGAFERRAPSQSEAQAQKTPTSPGPASPVRPPVPSAPKAPPGKEILVVASKVKDYIRVKSGFNTAASVMDALSDFVRSEADRAIRSAETNGRKTVLDRDCK